MRSFSGLKQSLLAAFLFSACLSGCSKEGKKSDDSNAAAGESVKENKVAEAPGGGDTAPAGKGALAYLHSDCSIVAHVDIKALAANAVIKANVIPVLREGLTKAQAGEEDFGTFMKLTQLDPIADFHEFSLCVGEFPKDGGKPKGIGTITGSIKPGIIAAIASTSKKMSAEKVVDLKGQKALRLDDGIFTQMTDGALSGGNDSALIEASMSKANAFANDFKALGDAALRVVVPAKTVKLGLGLPGSPFANFVEKIEGSSSMVVDLASTRLTLRIATVDNSAATELVGVAGVLLTQVPKTVGEDPEAILMASLAAAKTSSEGKNFVMTMQLPAAQFEGFAKLLAEAIRSEID